MRIIRSAVLLSAALLAASHAVAQNPLTDVTEPDPDARCRPLPDLHTVSSRGNVLRDTLTMAPATFNIDNSRMTRNVFNGRYNATLYRLDPGDSVNFLMRNRMEPVRYAGPDSVSHTNQHFHGYVVTPLPTAGDNVVPTSIPNPGENRNNFYVPKDQSQGLMWYHPHPHGVTAVQVSGGLAGAFIIGDLLEDFPQYRAAGDNERVMYIKETKDDAGVNQLNILGNTCTRMTIRPQEMQLWRIANMSPNTFVNLKLAGRQFIVLAWDGNRVIRPMVDDSLFISPGTRVEAVVIGWARAGAAPDSSELFTDAFQTGQRSRARRINLGWVVNRGTPSLQPLLPSVAGADAEIADSIANLVDEPDVNRVTIKFQLNGRNLQLNNASYHHDSVSTAVPWGQVQEWTLINETNFLHTFHIHQTDFVVTHINGVEQPDSVHLDNVFLGIHRRGQDTLWVGDTVVVRFTYKQIASGPFVYHCHVLGHEDAGMIANMCVYEQSSGITYCRRWFPKGPYPPATADAARPAAQPVGAEAHAHGGDGDGGGGEGGGGRER